MEKKPQRKRERNAWKKFEKLPLKIVGTIEPSRRLGKVLAEFVEAELKRNPIHTSEQK